MIGLSQGRELTLSKFSQSVNLVLNNGRFIYDDVIGLKLFGKFWKILTLSYLGDHMTLCDTFATL